MSIHFAAPHYVWDVQDPVVRKPVNANSKVNKGSYFSCQKVSITLILTGRLILSKVKTQRKKDLQKSASPGPDVLGPLSNNRHSNTPEGTTEPSFINQLLEQAPKPLTACCHSGFVCYWLLIWQFTFQLSESQLVSLLQDGSEKTQKKPL